MPVPHSLLTLGALTFVTLLAACECGGPPQAVPADTPVAKPAVRSIELGGIKGSVGQSWTPLEKDVLRRLETAALGEHVGATIELTAYNPGSDDRPGLMMFRMTTGSSDGAPPDLQALIEARIAEAERMAALRNAKANKSQACTSKGCDLAISIEGPTIRQELRSRLWLADDQAVEVACGCLDEGCTFIEQCTLPDAP